MKPVASVIIPVLNREDCIGDLLVALKGQAGVPGELEIIVIDNGSTDRTVEVVKKHGVTLLHQPKRGPSAARNLGLAHAQGDVILCTDSDCIPTRRWAAALIAAIANPEVGVVTGTILGWQPSTGAERYCASKGSGTRKFTIDNPKHPFAPGMHTTVRREDLLAIGGWDETMGSGEDVDLCFRLRKRFGKPICFVDAAVLFHKHRATDEALWKQARWHGAGFFLVGRRHPELLRWRFYHTPLTYLSLGISNLGIPLLWLGRRLRLVSPERMEFETYHRRWLRSFWMGCLDERKKEQQ